MAMAIRLIFCFEEGNIVGSWFISKATKYKIIIINLNTNLKLFFLSGTHHGCKHVVSWCSVHADAAAKGGGQGKEDDRKLRQLKIGKKSKSRKSKAKSSKLHSNQPSSGPSLNSCSIASLVGDIKSFDFTFEDGTRVSSSYTSESNMVEVKVQGPLFNLDISCSDPFLI